MKKSKKKQDGKKSDRQVAMLPKAHVKKRGWTDTLIERFMPAPDETRPNPKYQKAAPMKLYRLDRIERLEASQEFQDDLTKAAKRKESSRKVAERKRKETLEWADSVPPPTLPERTEEELVELAVNHYNTFWASRGKYEKKRLA